MSDKECKRVQLSDGHWPVPSFYTRTTNSEDYSRKEFLQENIPDEHERLLVLKGVPCHLDNQTIINQIVKTLSSLGGFNKDDIFIPKIKENSMGSKIYVTLNTGYAVVRVNHKCKNTEIIKELERHSVFSLSEEYANKLKEVKFSISFVDCSLTCIDSTVQSIFNEYLHSQLFDYDFYLNERAKMSLKSFWSSLLV